MARWPSTRIAGALRALVVLRFCFHALFLPVFEGPDEPFHLARVRQVLTNNLGAALNGSTVDPSLVGSLREWPCSMSLHAAFGCPLFGREAAAFNILAPPREGPVASPSENYQAHQPPTYYLISGAVLRLTPGVAGSAPERQLLTLRLASVALVALALAIPVRRIGMHAPRFEICLLLALLVPGAAESLARVANDVGVFAWAAFLLSMLYRQTPTTTRLALMCALGPLIKLTAIPIVGYAAVVQFRRRGWRQGAAAAAASLAFLPLQWFRGWAWGGTLEANAFSVGDFTPLEILSGVLHSVYTFTKTSYWLGGWVSFRPPAWILLAFPLVLTVVLVRATRLRPDPESRLAHLAGASLALLGFIAFAIGKKKVFGVWGAVGGWYAWGWAPWIALGWTDFTRMREERNVETAVAAFTIALVLNVTWFAIAERVYN